MPCKFNFSSMKYPTFEEPLLFFQKFHQFHLKFKFSKISFIPFLSCTRTHYSALVFLIFCLGNKKRQRFFQYLFFCVLTCALSAIINNLNHIFTFFFTFASNKSLRILRSCIALTVLRIGPY